MIQSRPDGRTSSRMRARSTSRGRPPTPPWRTRTDAAACRSAPPRSRDPPCCRRTPAPPPDGPRRRTTARTRSALAALAVARVAAPPQRTAAPFQPHRRQVVKHQGAVLQMPLGQAPLDGVLTLEQPVHRRRKDRPRRSLPAPTSPSESRAVASAKPRAVASFRPWIRATIIASRIGARASPPRRSSDPVAACAASRARPRHGRTNARSKASSRRDTAAPPLSSTRKPSMSVGGHLERLARVRFLTLPAARKDSRRSTAGGELRLGTLSMIFVLNAKVYVA